MHNVHQLILRDGVEEARRQASTRHERALVEAAFKMLSDENDRLGFIYSGFALTSLPHKPVEEGLWRREGHNLTMIVQSGATSSGELLGVPYGSYARFILLYLQSQAIRSNSREIELGRSMRVWLGNMGLSIGGKTYRQVGEQARRISGCRLQFFTSQGKMELMRHGGFVEGSISLAGVNASDQPSLWNEKVLINEEFFRAMKSHPVPLSEAALRAIGPRSMVLDVYIWLAYRLHVLTTDVLITWSALHIQFGAGFRRLRSFRTQFVESVELAVAAYPEARLSVCEMGVTLRPSPPAIAKAG